MEYSKSKQHLLNVYQFSFHGLSETVTKPLSDLFVVGEGCQEFRPGIWIETCVDHWVKLSASVKTSEVGIEWRFPALCSA